jgi:hypothetical protein
MDEDVIPEKRCALSYSMLYRLKTIQSAYTDISRLALPVHEP